MNIALFIFGIIGLLANTITIINFFSIKKSTIPSQVPINVDFAYLILFVTSVIFVAGWIKIKDELYLDIGVERFIDIIVGIVLLVVTILGINAFGEPNALFFDTIYGPLAFLFTGKNWLLQ